MAANYWTSTQRQHWLFDREKLAERRKFLEEVDKSFIQQYPLPDFRLFNIYVNQRRLITLLSNKHGGILIYGKQRREYGS